MHVFNLNIIAENDLCWVAYLQKVERLKWNRVSHYRKSVFYALLVTPT